MAVHVPVIESKQTCPGCLIFFSSQGFGWAMSLPAHCFPCLTVFAVSSHAWPEDMLHGSAQASLSPTCAAYVV